MKKHLLIKRKTKGDGAYIATLISILFILILILGIVLSYSQMSKQNKVERIARRYLLEMEKTGYLKDTGRADLIADLTEAGVESIDLSDTTFSAVEYGGVVTLRIRGNLKVEQLIFGDTISKGEGVVHVDITKTVTALF